MGTPRQDLYSRDRRGWQAVVDYVCLVTDAAGWIKTVGGWLLVGGSAGGSAKMIGEFPTLAAVIVGVGAGLLGWPAIYRGWRKLTEFFHPVRFFPTQGHKDSSEWGGLREELESVRTAWVAFESANYLADTSGEYHESIERMMVLDCNKDDGFLDTYLSVRPTKETRNRRQIREQVQEAVGKIGVEGTRLVDAPIMNLVIGDPGTRCTWVRLHYQMPFTEADNWPDIVIEWRKHPRVVERIESAYDSLWGSDRASKPPKTWGESPDDASESAPQT